MYKTDLTRKLIITIEKKILVSRNGKIFAKKSETFTTLFTTHKRIFEKFMLSRLHLKIRRDTTTSGDDITMQG